MGNIVYESVFKDEFASLVDLKRALGFKYETEERSFKRLDNFFIENGVNEKIISKEISDKWCNKRSYESSANHSSRISILRVFCEYIASLGISTYIPAKGITRHPPKYDAHIYTDDELKRFFHVVDQSKSVPSECPYRGLVMPIFFRILYTSGLRLSELRLARICDVNLEEGYITVRNGKNMKDRYVPIHPDLVKECIELKNVIHKSSNDTEYFFMIQPGRPMTLQNVYRNFRRYLEKANISHTGKGPRIHDFRHTYCVNLLLKWTKEDKDLMAYIPYMRVMLGHETFEETAYYLKLTASAYPEVRKRLEKSFPNIIEEVNFNDKEYY